VAGLGAVLCLGLGDESHAPLAVAPPSDYRAVVYHETGCPQDPEGDRFVCLEDLLETMGAGGLKFFRSSVVSLTAGPEGILGSADTVLVKINYQWPERGGTNVDLLRGLIRRILEHPDGFAGEIVVCENSQFRPIDNFDRATNNAQDPDLSPHDVVLGFQGPGRRVSLADWTALRGTSVQEYSAGDLNPGYVVLPYDARVAGSVSYPKFTTAHGTRVSLKLGVWDAGSGYDRGRLKVINLPVLKSHHAVYGATAAVKNYMGVVTTGLGTNAHAAVGQGMLGVVLGEIDIPDLNILDAIWTSGNPNLGPQLSYADARRADQLAASLDPVALDRFGVSNILIPAFVAGGHAPPWPVPSADPDLSSGAFRTYLDRSMGYLLLKGHEVTNDPARTDVVGLGPPGEASDPGGTGAPFTISRHAEGFELVWSSPLRGDAVEDYVLYRVPIAGLAAGALAECEAGIGSGTIAVVPRLPDDHAFVVVARNAAGEGSLGRDGQGRDRAAPAAAGSCP
jgi:hypothetical protein